MVKTDKSMGQKVAALANELINWRRKLHSFPELSFQEYETAKFIAEILRSIEGMDVKTEVAKTGVVGTLSSGEGPTIALRADIDALPIVDEKVQEYCSKNEGVMHACGHDAHAAILLGVAQLLGQSFKKGEVKGTVKFIFQPSEEALDEHGLSGAPYMIREGVLDQVDAILALHMCPWRPVGEVQVNDGYSMSNVDVFKGKIIGTGGHGAYPHLGTDPIWMLGPFLQVVHGIVARKVSPLDPAVVSIGKIQAGTASNIIPSEVEIEGTIRSYSSEVREFLVKEVESAFKFVESLGGTYSVEVELGEPALKNNPEVNRWIVDTINDLYPEMNIFKSPFGLGGEDFGHMTEVVPGAMFFIGCAMPDGIQRDLHTPTFDIDERCLPIGTAILAETAKRYLNGQVRLMNDKHDWKVV